MLQLTFLFKYQDEGSEAWQWNKNIESIRKDVECTFGILKKRFAILKCGFRQHKIHKCGDIFLSCCILYNILLDYDGRDDWNNIMLDENDINCEVENELSTMDGIEEQVAALDDKEREELLVGDN